MGLITRILSGDPRIFPYLARTDTLPRNICLLRSLRPRGTICGTGFHARHPAPRGQHWINRVGEVLAMDKGAEDGLLWMAYYGCRQGAEPWPERCSQEDYMGGGGAMQISVQ